MMFHIEERVLCSGGGSELHEIRVFVCGLQRSKDLESNPMEKFNPLLDGIIQKAFDAGRKYEQEKNGVRK